MILTLSKEPKWKYTFFCIHILHYLFIYEVEYTYIRTPERPFNEYPQLRGIGEIEIHKPEFYQRGRGMWVYGVLRYRH